MSTLTPIEVPSDTEKAKALAVKEASEQYLASFARADCLKKINGVLEVFNVSPWTDSHLGIASQGQCEIVDMVDMEEIVEGKRVRLTFHVRLPTGTYKDVSVNFGGKVMFVVPYLQLPNRDDDAINQVYLVKRWRVETGNWSYELPHGLVFDDGNDFSDPINSPAHEILSCTFGIKAVNHLGSAHVSSLGDLTLKGENSSANTCVLAAHIRSPFERRLGDCEIVRLSMRQTIALIEQGTKITDVNTVATLLRAAKKFGNR